MANLSCTALVAEFETLIERKFHPMHNRFELVTEQSSLKERRCPDMP